MSAEVSTPSTRDPRLLAAAHDAFRHLDHSLTPDERSWLDAVPAMDMIEALDACPPTPRLVFTNPRVCELIDRVRRMGGDRWFDKYVRIVLVHLLVRMLARPPAHRVPASIDALLRDDLGRIVRGAYEIDDAELYELDGDLILDLGICSGTILPLGVLFAHVGFTMRTVVLDAAGLGHLPAHPWISTHLRQSRRPPLNSESRSATYVLAGHFMAENPEYQGLFGLTWWADPVVAEISPHLSWIKRQHEAIGAHVFAMDTTDDATITHATSTSRTRRRMYEEGRYTPTDYGLVIQRGDLIRWAESLPIEDSG